MEPKIIRDFKEATLQYFDSPEEQELFLDTPEHWWGSFNKAPNINKTCYQYLCTSRQKDRLDYAIRTVVQLKSYIGVID